MTHRREKCGRCTIAGDAPCRGQINARVCTLMDPTSPEHRPGYDPTWKPPSLVAQASSFVGAVVRHVVSGSKAPPEVAAARLAICESNACGFFAGGGCGACGCGERGVALKASWAESTCPLDPPLWGPVPGPAG